VVVAPRETQPAARGGKPPLLVGDGDNATTQLLARVLREAHGSVEVRYSHTLVGADVRDRVVAFSRLCLPSHGWLPAHLASRGIRYLYVLDDNFWALTPEVDRNHADFYGHPAVQRTLETFVAGAAAVVVMTHRLGDAIRERVPPARVAYLNPPFDTAKANAILASAAPRAADGIVRIGYPTTRRPSVAPVLVPAVREVLARFAGRVSFEFVGWMPDELAGLPGVTLFPAIDDYDRYLEFKLARQWDVGLAPLAGSAFDACKTSLKYREYGGCRIAGVYAAVAPYADDVADGETGLLAAFDPSAWVDAIGRLVVDPPLRARVAARAHADVQSRFAQSLSAQRWRAIADEVLA